ncbi:uncharacterized protein KZ484_017332 isoform 2-T2 [Pholidichthys leucotaenia]
MSVPTLIDPPAMPTMVSRLPRFGSRPRSQTLPPAASSATPITSSTRLTNGFYHHPGPAGADTTSATPPASAKQNGFIRVPGSFSMKWKKENEVTEDGRRRDIGNVGQNRSGIHQFSSQHDSKKTTLSTVGKGRGFGQSVTSSSPSPQSSPQTFSAFKTGSKLSQIANGLSHGTKQTLNRVSGTKPWTNSTVRRPQSLARLGSSRPDSGPGSRSGSPLHKKSTANRSHSSDSLGSAPPPHLTEEDRFRSRSLTQVQRQPSPTLTSSSTTTTSSSSSLSCSPSISRGSLLKPPSGKVQSTAVAASGRVGVSSLLKKPLLPSLGPGSRPSGVSYKLSRPSLVKQSRPLRVTPANVHGDEKDVNGQRNSVETPSTTENSPETTPEVPETEGLSAGPVFHGEVSIIGETLEDMSLSSTSSLDRNDTSQEYMDDFDNLGNGGVNVLLISAKNDEEDSGLDQSCARLDDNNVSINGITKATGLHFLEDGMDWSSMKLSGEQGENRLARLSRRRRSSQPDYHEQGGSSLDLSPSDSCGSGGTYMWDEEGLEPLEGPNTSASVHTDGSTTHHIGSFDSDLNSIDILNNLESCDLADDDLMLDVDFPEDGSLHSADGDGFSHMAQWRRRQLCWGTQDIHNDNESDFPSYKLTEDPRNKRTDMTRDRDFILNLCPTRSVCLSPGTPSLGLDVEELAEDCSAVRSQLEYLQKLLLQEEDMDDDTLTTDTLSPDTNDSSHSSDSQVQALLQEVQQLREELRSRDRTIAQLTQQLTVPTVTTRCRCQEMRRTDGQTQTSATESESVASQTPWREHSQILHSSNQEDQEPLTDRILIQTPLPSHPLPDLPADRLSRHPETAAATQKDGDNGGKLKREEERGEKKGTRGTSLLHPPQTSKICYFPSSTTVSSIAPKARASRQSPSHEHNTNSKSGLKLKVLAFTSCSSRLPKPKSH